MNLKNKLEGPWTKKKILVLLSLILIIPLAAYGITTGVRLFRLYHTVHEPLDEEQAAEPVNRDYQMPDDPSDEPPDENSETDSPDPIEDDTADNASEEDPEELEGFPGYQNADEELDLVPITGKNIWDFQEIDRPFYVAATAAESPDHINILLLGLDEDIDEPGRSDSMMLMRFNIETEEAAILSIPRDTYIHIPGQGYDKAGHATAYGGTVLAKKTIENFLDISIDHYLRVDMSGFENSVDALGGVTLEIPERMVQEDGKVLFEAGRKHLDGEDALVYTRARSLKEGTGGDLGRIRRQQQVIFKMLRKIRSELSMHEALSFMEEISPYIRTDIGPGLIVEHWGAFNRLDFQAIDIRTLPGESFTHEHIYYFRVPVENARIIVDSLAN